MAALSPPRCARNGAVVLSPRRPVVVRPVPQGSTCPAPSGNTPRHPRLAAVEIRALECRSVSAAKRSAHLAGRITAWRRLLMAGGFPQQSGLPSADGECGRPETERPEDD